MASASSSSARTSKPRNYKTYTTDQLRFPGRPRHPLQMLRPQELLDAFRDFRVLAYQEIVKDRGVAQLIAQKPVSSEW